MRNDNKVLIGGGSFFAAAMIMLMSALVQSAFYMNLGDGAAYTVWRNITAIITQTLLVLAVYLFCRKTKTKPDYLLKKPTAAASAAAVATTAAGIIGFYLIASLFGYGLEGMGYTSSAYGITTPLDWVFSIVRVIIFAPLCEEILFRGGVLSGTNSLFGGKRSGAVWSVMLCGALFMLLHMNPEQTVYQFLFGCLLAMLTISTKNIVPAVIAHILNNAVALVLEMPFASGLDGALHSFFTSIPWLFVLTAVLLAAAALAGMFFLNKKIAKADRADGTEPRQEVIDGKVRLIGIALFIFGAVICALVWVMQLVAGISGGV